MGQCLHKTSHSCGSRSGLQVFSRDDGTVDGFCYSCGTYVRHPYGGEEKKLTDLPKSKLGLSKEEVEAKIEEISALGCMDLKDRRLRGMYLEHFGIKIGLSEEDGKTIAFHHYPYTKDGQLQAYKTRYVPEKRMWSVGNQKDVDFFGWEQAKRANSRKLIICEGELDAVAMYAILSMHTKGEYKDNIPAVISLPHGVGSAGRDVSANVEKFRKHFKEFVLCFDMDEPGQEGVQDVLKVLPEAVVASLPDKDANDCIKNGSSKAAFSAVMWNASAPKNTRLVWGRDVHEEAKQPAEWGLSFPWETLNEITRGLRFGETYYVAAGEKMGKSEIVNAFTSHFITEHGLKVMVAKPEEANNKTYKMVLSKVAGKVFHDPKVEFDGDAYEEAGAIIQDKLCMLNLYQHVGWDTLKDDIRAASSAGVKLVIIDPITNLTNGMSNSDIDSHLKGVAQEAAAMAMDLDIAIMFFCHLNKPPKGTTPWDRGGKITTDYFAGSSAMARSCNYAIGLEGNKDPELSEEERNMRQLVVLADREFGESGKVRLFWDRITTKFREV